MTAPTNPYSRIALLASDTERAQEAYDALYPQQEWAPLDEADCAVVLGGDGFMLQTLHAMIDAGRIIPAYGMNLGTVGFLMNKYDKRASIAKRLARAHRKAIAPLRMHAVTQSGEETTVCAINEVSLLRETRQTAWIEVTVGDRVRIAKLICDGVLVSTPAGSTAYNATSPR